MKEFQKAQIFLFNKNFKSHKQQKFQCFLGNEVFAFKETIFRIELKSFGIMQEFHFDI